MKGYHDFFDAAGAFFDKWASRAQKGAGYIRAVTAIIEAGHKLIKSESFRALCREIKARVLQTLKALEDAYRRARRWYIEEKVFYTPARVACSPMFLLW